MSWTEPVRMNKTIYMEHRDTFRVHYMNCAICSVQQTARKCRALVPMDVRTASALIQSPVDEIGKLRNINLRIYGSTPWGKHEYGKCQTGI
jgi:hypothetical protein